VIASFSTRFKSFGIVGWRVEDVAVFVRAARVVGHDADVGLADDVATEVLVEIDRGLQGHAEVAGLIVGVEKVVRVVDVVNVAPSTAVVRLEECRESYVLEDALPVERKMKIAQRTLVDLGGNSCAEGARSSGWLRLI